MFSLNRWHTDRVDGSTYEMPISWGVIKSASQTSMTIPQLLCPLPVEERPFRAALKSS